MKVITYYAWSNREPEEKLVWINKK
ncbi:hypothetical protein [Metabacillus endolithicus]|uniref:Non-reducing end beta-L-arabinofuranosidase-like GH127 C-terminal domain-containing protein n=1 Tax=Metabacillus endolithicus TaxID=1535204 RepID=A0ABW5BTW3_9BACI